MTSGKLLVDTDVLIDFLRKKPQAQKLLEEASAIYDLYISAVTLSELLTGMKPSEEAATETLIEGLTLIPVTEKIARRAGALRRQAHSRKTLLPDCLIAATALEEECLLLTFNKKDFFFTELEFYPAA